LRLHVNGDLCLGIENLNLIFNPHRIAVIGASDKEGSLGAKILRNLIGVGYKGTVFPVNPFMQCVQGIMAYPTVNKIPKKIDLAVIATPAHTIPQIIEECGEAGIPGIIITSAGFREIGEEGAKLEQKILQYKQRYGMRIIGPNSFGVIRPKINLYATFGDKRAIEGKIAFISQSAALCAAVMDWAMEAQVGLSAVVSTGSMLDVDLGDLIDFFGTDAQTKSIILYVESLKNARNFMSATRNFARTKPIVVVRAGRFKESSTQAQFHSGFLAGEDMVYDAAFKRAGIVRVETIVDLLNCAEALAMQPNPIGPNLTIITNAGGPGIMASDYLIDKGGKLSQLNYETREQLQRTLPPYCSTINPIDLLEEATPERFRTVLEICLKDSTSNGFLIIYTPQGATEPSALSKIVTDLSKQTKKPVIVSLIGEDVQCWKARKTLQRKGVPAFNTPEQAVATFMYMYSYTQNLELLYQTPEELGVNQKPPQHLKEIISKAFSEKRQILSLPEAMQFITAYNIPFVKTLVAKTPSEAASLAAELIFPVAMKVLSPQITHKSKAEGVILNICFPEKIKYYFDEITKKVNNYNNTAELKGVIIQPMVQGEFELIIGSKKDPQFGSVIVFGKGGTTTDQHKEVSIGLPPLNQILARRLIENKEIYNGITKNTTLKTKLEGILTRLSDLIIDFPEIKELDINPLIIQKNEVIAVDARISLDSNFYKREVGPHEHLVIAPYPSQYISRWKLKDGTPVLLRPVKPEDEELFKKLFLLLSPETMRFRFFQIIKDISHETMTRYCNIDYDREIAIIAELSEKEKQIIGTVRLIVEPNKEKGEFAILVSDQWQGFGLGVKLVEYLHQLAEDMNLKQIYGYVIHDNYKMLKLMQKQMFKIERSDEDTYLVSLDTSNQKERGEQIE
jgi:acetyltransferase